MPAVRALFVAAMALSLASQPSAQGWQGAAAISGVVVDGVTGQPLSGAVVTLGRLGGPRDELGSVLTDARGQFVFVGLPATPVAVLAATRSGYLGGGPLTRGGTAPAHVRISLTGDEWVRDVRLAIFRPGTIEGTIRDESGEPAVGIQVRSVALVRVAGHDHLASGPIALTDDRGRYRIAGLPPGRYLIVVPSVQTAIPAGMLDMTVQRLPEADYATALTDSRSLASIPTIDSPLGMQLAGGQHLPPPPPADGQSFAYPVTFYPGVPTPAEAVAVELDRAGVRRGTDVTLSPVPAATIEGRIVGASNVTGALVRLMPAGAEGLGPGFESAIAQSTGDGSFVLVNVPTGNYVLEARPQMSEYRLGVDALEVLARPSLLQAGGVQRLTLSGRGNSGLMLLHYPTGDSPSHAAVPGTPARPASASVRVDVTPAGLSGLILPVLPPSTLSGRVRFEGDPDGSTPDGLRLALVADSARGRASAGSPRAASEPIDYRFAIPDLEADAYFVRLAPSGSWIVRSITSAVGDYTDAPIDLTGGGDVDDLIVILTNQSGAIEGRVTGPGGAPYAGATVAVFPANQSLWTDFGSAPPRLSETTSGSDGAYAIGRLPAGEYHVTVVPDAELGRWRDTAFFAKAAASARRVSIGWGDTRTVALDAPAP